MRRAALVTLALWGAPLLAQAPARLSVHWEELTAGDFVAGIERSQGVCLLPVGILEKHGPHLPIGSDLLDVRYVTTRAAGQEYAVVFPQYFASQIFEAQHQPGTVSYSAELQLKLLQETVAEMARNGCKKTIIVNGHGGNNSFLPYFAQSQLASPRDYVVYVFDLPDLPDELAARRDSINMHAGETETSQMMIVAPNLVQMDRAGRESGADQARQKLPPSLYTGIWWYARFPNHYSGVGTAGDSAFGRRRIDAWTQKIVEAIRAVKADDESLRLQSQYFEEAKHPLRARQVRPPPD